MVGVRYGEWAKTYPLSEAGKSTSMSVTVRVQLPLVQGLWRWETFQAPGRLTWAEFAREFLPSGGDGTTRFTPTFPRLAQDEQRSLTEMLAASSDGTLSFHRVRLSYR
jgi:hypothetical protein